MTSCLAYRCDLFIWFLSISNWYYFIDGNGRPQTAVPDSVKVYERQLAEGGEDEGQRKPSKQI